MKELLEIQARLKAPKSQFNNFGKYKYRSLEDILEAVKPIMHDLKCVLIISDDVCQCGDRYYIEATATLINSANDKISVKSLARESFDKKGMDDSQITGTASSYARKYALNGLFAIDDTKDADATNEHETKQTAKISEQQFNILTDLIIGTETDEVSFCGFFKIPRVVDLKADDFARARAMLEKKLGVKK